MKNSQLNNGLNKIVSLLISRFEDGASIMLHYAGSNIIRKKKMKKE